MNFNLSDARQRVLDTSMGFVTNTKSEYFDPSKSTLSPPKTRPMASLVSGASGREIHVKPRLLESGLAKDETFNKLPEGFKRIFGEDTTD